MDWKKAGWKAQQMAASLVDLMAWMKVAWMVAMKVVQKVDQLAGLMDL